MAVNFATVQVGMQVWVNGHRDRSMARWLGTILRVTAKRIFVAGERVDTVNGNNVLKVAEEGWFARANGQGVEARNDWVSGYASVEQVEAYELKIRAHSARERILAAEKKKLDGLFRGKSFELQRRQELYGLRVDNLCASQVRLIAAVLAQEE